MRFDYTQADWAFVARVLNENSLRLSRTRQGVADTGTSAQKQPLLLVGEELRRRSAENEEQVHRFLFATRSDPTPRNADEVSALLWTVADLTNAGLLPAGKLRTWAIGAHQAATHGGPVVSGPEAKVDPENLPAALGAFAEAVHQRWPELRTDPVPLTAWAEWELNGGRLHPFYDGCGRIARSFGALLLIRGSVLLPLYDDAASYFEHGNRGQEAFATYMRERIEACASWVSTWYPPSARSGARE